MRHRSFISAFVCVWLLTGLGRLCAEMGSHSILGINLDPPEMSVADMLSEGITPPAPTQQPKPLTPEELEKLQKDQNWLFTTMDEQQKLKDNLEANNSEANQQAEKKKSELDPNYKLRTSTVEELLKKSKAPPKGLDDESWRYKPLTEPLSDLMSKDSSFSSGAVMKTEGSNLYQSSRATTKASNVKAYEENLQSSQESVGLNSTSLFSYPTSSSTPQPLNLNSVQINPTSGVVGPMKTDSGWGQAEDLLKKNASINTAPMSSSNFNDALMQKMLAPQAPQAPQVLGANLNVPNLNPAQLQVKTPGITITAPPVPFNKTFPVRTRLKTPAEIFGH